MHFFRQESANDLIREFQSLAQQVRQLEKRLDQQVASACLPKSETVYEAGDGL